MAAGYKSQSSTSHSMLPYSALKVSCRQSDPGKCSRDCGAGLGHVDEAIEVHGRGHHDPRQQAQR